MGGGRGGGGDRATGRRNFSLQDEGYTLSGNEMRAAINETHSRDFKFFFSGCIIVIMLLIHIRYIRAFFHFEFISNSRQMNFYLLTSVPNAGPEIIIKTGKVYTLRVH